MSLELKLQIFFAVSMCGMLWVLTMILARTLTLLEYSMGRIEEIAGKELSLARRQLEQEKASAEKAAHQTDRHARNDLLLQIPFMDRLDKDKRPGNG